MMYHGRELCLIKALLVFPLPHRKPLAPFLPPPHPRMPWSSKPPTPSSPSTAPPAFTHLIGAVWLDDQGVHMCHLVYPGRDLLVLGKLPIVTLRTHANKGRWKRGILGNHGNH